jgi:uncharacterized membrane protein YfcA
VTAVEVMAFFVLGLALGWLGGLFGIGGGIFAIPILGLAFRLNQQQAQGTALVMIVPTVLIGAYQYWRRGGIDARIALLLAATAAPMTFLFARIAVALPSAPLRRDFALFLIAVAAYYAFRAYAESRTDRNDIRLPWQLTGLVGILGGILSGIFTVGGAVFSTPLLTIAFGMSQTVAQGLGLALVIPGLVIGLSVYGAAGDVHWPIGIALAAGSILTVSSGVAFAHRLPEPTLKYAFAAFMALAGLLLWVKAAAV